MLTLWFPNTSTSRTCILKLGSCWRFLASGRRKTESWRSEGKPGGGEAEKSTARRAETRFMPPAYKLDTRHSVFSFAVFVFFFKKVILVPLLGWIVTGLLWFEDVTENGHLRRVMPPGRHLDDARSYFWGAKQKHSAPSDINQDIKTARVDSTLLIVFGDCAPKLRFNTSTTHASSIFFLNFLWGAM